MNCFEKLARCSANNDSLVCVGLDTDPDKIPAHLGGGSKGILDFNRAIIEATSDLVCAYKPNAAFYEALGAPGFEALKETCRSIPRDVPVILDVKRGDIGNTAERYAEAAYDIIGADAVTVNPYMGFDAVRPFLRESKAVFVLCVTSNPSAGEFQFLDTGGGMLYERVAHAALGWSKHGDIGLVVGATRPEVMQGIRGIVGDMPILVPGVGAQGGDLAGVLKYCGGKSGRTVINSSRGILYASGGRDYAQAARDSLIGLRNDISAARV